MELPRFLAFSMAMGGIEPFEAPIFFSNLTMAGNSPLHREIVIGELKDAVVGESPLARIKAHIEDGDNVNAQNGCGSTPLHYACVIGNADIVMMLLEAGAAPDIPDREKWTPLHNVCSEGWLKCHAKFGPGHAGCVEALIEAGANVNMQSAAGYTPLHLAYMNKQPEIADKLIRAGADSTLLDKNGRSPLFYRE